MTQKNSDDLIRIVAKNVKSERLRIGLSQQKLAELTGLSVRYISRLETESQNIRIDKLEALSRALGISPIQLLQGVDGSRLSPTIANQLTEAMKILQSIHAHCVND